MTRGRLGRYSFGVQLLHLLLQTVYSGAFRTSSTPASSSTSGHRPTRSIRLVLETFRDRLFTEIFPGAQHRTQDVDLL